MNLIIFIAQIFVLEPWSKRHKFSYHISEEYASRLYAIYLDIRSTTKLYISEQGLRNMKTALFDCIQADDMERKYQNSHFRYQNKV